MSTLSVPGFAGEISQVQLLPEGEAALPTGPDLLRLAAGALGYLIRNPDSEHAYQSRFSFFLLNSPPFAPLIPPIHDLIDPIAVGDTESRNEVAFNQLREMLRSEAGREVQEAVHERLVSYIREGTGRVGDNLCWAVPYCMAALEDCDGPWAMIWTSTKLLQSESQRYRLSGDERARRRARQIFDGLRAVAVWDTGRAYFPGGVRPFRGERLANGYHGHYPPILTPLLEYGLACDDPQAVEFAQAMAEGFLADLQPGHLHRPDGHLYGHLHLQMHAVRGLAQLGALTHDMRYLTWAQAAYGHHQANAFDTGWLPESCWLVDHSNHSETCLTSDMLETEVWLACGGLPQMWDRVERTLRNYLLPAYFTLTPEITALWCRVNQDRTAGEVEAGLAWLRTLEGGFLSALTPNDRVFEVRPGTNHHGKVHLAGRDVVLDMMGCCPPEGVRMLYLAWAYTVQRTGEGVLVNLAFDHDGPLATVASSMPGRGHLRVTPHVASSFYLRPPAWTPRASVGVRRNGAAVPSIWGGPACAYVRLEDVQPGETLELTWPLLTFNQTVTMRRTVEEGQTLRALWGPSYTYQWVGNVVRAVHPRGEWLPLYE